MGEIDQNIIRLLSEYLMQELSEERSAELQGWLEEKEANRQFFEQYCADQSLHQRWESRQRIDAEAAIAAFDQRTRKLVTLGGRRRWLAYAGVAAVLFMGLGISFLFWPGAVAPEEQVVEAHIVPGTSRAMLILADGEKMNLGAQDSVVVCLKTGMQLTNRNNQLVYQGEPTGIIQYNELHIPRGGEYQVVLADGTVVHLNSGSSLRYPVTFGLEKREVFLSGEAYFEVRKATVPFLVRVCDLTVKVYGTSFNINTHIEDRIQTALVEGKVGISIKGEEKEYLLTPSQLADFNVHSGVMDIRTADLAPYLAWTKGLFIFNNESLEQIMSTLSLWYDMDVFYQNASLQHLHFTGCVKRYESIDQILKALSQSVGVKFTQQGKTLIISY